MPRIIKSAKGTFTTADITIDGSGRVVTASTGSAGGAGAVIATLAKEGPASGTYTAGGNASNIVAYMASGGGGGGASGSTNPEVGGEGGDGALGVYSAEISQPYSKTYAVGAAGQGRNVGPSNTGGTTNITDLGTVTGGTVGGINNSQGSIGAAPGADNTVANVDASMFMGGAYGNPGYGPIGKVATGGGPIPGSPAQTGRQGSPGFLFVYEDK